MKQLMQAIEFLFIFGIVTFGILTSVFLSINKQWSLHKFKKENSIHFFNKKAFIICLIWFTLSIVTSIIVTILIIINWIISSDTKALNFILSVVYLIQLTTVCTTYFIFKIYAKSIYFIIIDEQIIIDNETISFGEIHNITNDEKRKNIFIHYVNSEKKGKIKTIKYNWELKDLIIENKINNRFI